MGFNTWNLSGSAGPGETSFFTSGPNPCLSDDNGSLEDNQFYDNGLLGSARFALSENTSILIAETGQVCPDNYNYLTQVTLEVFNTAPLFEQEEEFPMSEWTPFTFSGTALLTDAVLEPNSPSANAEPLVIDYFDGYGDGSGPWSISDVGGNVVATGSMADGPAEGVPTSNSGSVALAPGHYTFSWDVDCYGAYDNSGIQLSLNGETLADFAPGTLSPGIITTDIFIPGIVIVPPFATVDTTCDAVFSHDLMATGALPPSTPGTYIANEDNIQLGFEMFFDGFGATYGSAAVTSALPTVGSGQVLTTSNILAVYDMSAFPNVNEVSFVFFDGAGIENLQVNGHALLTGELETMPTAVAPGVTMSVTTSAYPGYQTGTVVLTGNVQKLEIGGQQFFVDHICVKHDGTVIQAPNTGGCTATCDVFTGFDVLTAGDRYGDPAEGANINVAPGTQATTSDGVPIYLEPLHDFGSTYYNYMAVDAHYGGWGTGMSLWTNNITAQFDIQSVVDITDTVCIEFRDEGGFENLWVNGAAPATSPNGYGGLMVFNGAVIGGVQVQVTGANVGYAFEGTITLIGDVDKLSIGGQELWLDNLCISASPPPPSLAEVVAAEGEEGLLELLSVSFDPDTATCQVAMALQLESGFPLVDELQLQISNVQTGEVVSNSLIAVVIITALEGDGADEGDSGGPLINAVTAIEYGLIAANVPIPDVGEGETLSFSLVFSDFETTLVVEIPGLTFPGCPGGGIDFPCDVDATFAVLETPCGVFTILSAPQPSAMETWTLNGLPYMPTGDPNAFTLGLSEGVHTLCRTVTSLLLPNCSDTFCHPLIVDCSADSCDYSFTHETMSFGAVNTAVTYTEDHIDLTFAGYDDGLGSGPSLGNAFVDNAIPGIGTDQVLLLSNVNADYNLTNLVNVSRVTFDYFDGAGIENLMVNGSFMIDEFGALFGSTFTMGGVDVFITRASAAGYDYGEVILTGNVQSFAVGGQQFYVDDVCVSAEGVNCTNDQDGDGTCDEDEVAGCTNGTADNYDPAATDDDGSCEFGYNNDTTEVIANFAGSCPSSCDWLVDFGSQPIGTSWGDPASLPTFPMGPGSFMFNEGGVDMHIDQNVNALYGPTYNMNMITASPWAAFGSGQVMHTNNATVTFDLDSIPTDSVCLDILDFGGFEYLQVNGVGFSSLNGYGQLTAAPLNMGGVQVQVMGNPIITMTSAGPMVTGFNGRLVLQGNVDQLEIGGQEFWIDNLCISIASGAPVALDDFVENEGEGTLLTMLNPQVEFDSDGCNLAASLDLSDLNLPTADAIELQLIGADSGTIYASAPFALFSGTGGGTTAEMPESGSAGALGMPHMLVFDGLVLTDIPETNGEMLLVSIVVTEASTSVALGIDGLLVPGCNGGPIPGCTYADANNFDPEATLDDGSCILPEANPCPTDIDGDGVTATQDLLLLLGSFSLVCEE